MNFQIRDAEGIALTLNELDKEAADFWSKELTNDYAFPQVRQEGEYLSSFLSRQANWYDIIGFCISTKGHSCSGWANVVATMIAESIGIHFIDTTEGYKERPVKVAEFTNTLVGNEIIMHLPDELEIKIYSTLEFYKPYIALINHWAEKGYVGVRVYE